MVDGVIDGVIELGQERQCGKEMRRGEDRVIEVAL